jgi:CxxC motif-containing protein (DUF1111 family)
MSRRVCLTGKMKYFNKEWAQIYAARQQERLGPVFEPYRCPQCHWWHIRDKAKKRRTAEARESRSQRRARRAREKRQET